MQVEVKRAVSDRRKYTVMFTQGCQTFTLDYAASKKECEWMAKELRIAFAKFKGEYANE